MCLFSPRRNFKRLAAAYRGIGLKTCEQFQNVPLILSHSGRDEPDVCDHCLVRCFSSTAIVECDVHRGVVCCPCQLFLSMSTIFERLKARAQRRRRARLRAIERKMHRYTTLKTVSTLEQSTTELSSDTSQFTPQHLSRSFFFDATGGARLVDVIEAEKTRWAGLRLRIDGMIHTRHPDHLQPLSPLKADCHLGCNHCCLGARSGLLPGNGNRRRAGKCARGFADQQRSGDTIETSRPHIAKAASFVPA